MLLNTVLLLINAPKACKRKSQVNVYKPIGQLVYKIIQKYTVTHCPGLFKECFI